MYDVGPLGTACGTGGDRCIDMLIEHGGDINHQDSEGSTPLHQCFFRGTLKCLKALIKHNPDSNLTMIQGFPPLESAFRDDMDHMLEFILNCDDPEIGSILQKHPNLQV